jgi:hypothetical protein
MFWKFFIVLYVVVDKHMKVITGVFKEILQFRFQNYDASLFRLQIFIVTGDPFMVEILK